jgi:hypothetical protein
MRTAKIDVLLLDPVEGACPIPVVMSEKSREEQDFASNPEESESPRRPPPTIIRSTLLPP